MKKLIFFLLLFGNSILTYSQTLEETLNWIKGKLNDNHYQSYCINNEYTKFDFDLESNTIQIYFYEEENNLYKLNYYLDVPLEILNPTNVRTDSNKNTLCTSYNIQIRSIDNRYVFAMRESYNDTFSLYTENVIYERSFQEFIRIPIGKDLIQREPEVCSRLVKAFKHAIKLGGGKEEIF